MIAYLAGLATVPGLALLGAVALLAWHVTFDRTIGSGGCSACDATNPPHPHPRWEIGASPNIRWHWEGWRHHHITAKRADHRAYAAAHKARWGW